jgi:hypothetical protein
LCCPKTEGWAEAKKPAAKKLEPYKPMGLAGVAKEPSFTCDYCNSVNDP